MNGTTIATSIETGYPIPIVDKIELEPEVQGVFQHLDFPQRTDIDGIGVRSWQPKPRRPPRRSAPPGPRNDQATERWSRLI